MLCLYLRLWSEGSGERSKSQDTSVINTDGCFEFWGDFTIIFICTKITQSLNISRFIQIDLSLLSFSSSRILPLSKNTQGFQNLVYALLWNVITVLFLNRFIKSYVSPIAHVYVWTYHCIIMNTTRFVLLIVTWQIFNIIANSG